MRKLRSFGFAVLVLTAIVITAYGSPLTFTGNFTNDNDVVLIPFTLPATVLVTFQTFGYGGGINGNSQVIVPGGFESMLQLFAIPSGLRVGGSILPGPDGSGCGPRTPDPSRLDFCFDVFAQVSLSPGDYILALTQNPNTANGNLGDGFLYDADPNFNNGFVGTFGFQGTSHWALDIIAPGASVPTPEPRVALLMAPASLLIGVNQTPPY